MLPTIDKKKMRVGAILVPWPAPLLSFDGSLQRLRQPSSQHSVPFRHLMLSVHVFFSPMKQRRFLGGAGQVSAMKNKRIISLSETVEHFYSGQSTTVPKRLTWGLGNSNTEKSQKNQKCIHDHGLTEQW